MPRQTEPSDGPSSLPAPELNPLLNPVLGQNMGRWAEVYFTSPPEKREQAVLELLRELRAENPTGGEGSFTSATSGQEQAFEPVVAPASRSTEVAQSEVAQVEVAPPVPCPACGRENPASHRFCGMCGRPVAGRGAAADLPVADLPSADLPSADLAVADLQISDLHIADQPIESSARDETARLDKHNESQLVPSEEALNEPAARTNDFPLFRTGRDLYRDDRSDEILHDPPASRSYRVYVGIALAAVILALVYMAWRSTQATSSSAQGEPQAPSVATAQDAAPAPVPASASTAEIPDRTPPTSQQTTIPQQTAPETAPVQAAPSNTPATEQTQRPETAAGNGAEELATAQRYLNGTDGQEPNRVEAAKWLWKAVGKHNSEATILLSDLYLKGEGVGKNCDQARVLLDAAAREGVKDAGERLRHLQAFGCD